MTPLISGVLFVFLSGKCYNKLDVYADKSLTNTYKFRSDIDEIDF